MEETLNIKNWKTKNIIIRWLHILTLILCLFLITIISIDIFKDLPLLTHRLYMHIQFWICVGFITAFFIELLLREHKVHFFFTHLLFLIVSIPYLSLIEFTGVEFSKEAMYFLRFIPLIRGGYALAIVVSWLSYNKASSLLFTYLTILLSTVYFSSLIFFNVENPINPMVINYWDALWWAFMDVTTVGSNIYAVSRIGDILSVLLAAMGMMMFPIGTAYITDRIAKENQKRKSMHQQLYSKTAKGKNNPASPSVNATTAEDENQEKNRN